VLRRLAAEVRYELGMLRTIVHRRLYASPRRITAAVDAFHARYYDAELTGGTWRATSWLGVPTQKCPLDLWVYQEILHEVRPDVIVESGTARGGSALFLAGVCDALGGGRVLTIDRDELPGRPAHPRIQYLRGDSVAPDVVAAVRAAVAAGERVMVILDSDHRREHVRAELAAYAGLVTPGSYCVVEDTNLNGHPVRPDFGPGPMEAVHEFLAAHPEFAADRGREKLLMTFNPHGYLRRKW
jgi:cephalosporin hydroxylase